MYENESCEDNLTAFVITHTVAATTLQVISLLLFMIFTIIGCVAICYIIYKDKTLHNVTGAFVANLMISDICVAIFNMPVALVSCIVSGGIKNDALCQIAGVSNSLFRYASILTLAAISVDRYIAVVRPLKYFSVMTPRRCYMIIFGIWIQSITFALLPLMGWGRYIYKPEEFICRPSFLWPSEDHGFTLAIFVTCFLTPFAIIIATSIRIVHIAKAQRKKVGSVAAKVRDGPSISGATGISYSFYEGTKDYNHSLSISSTGKMLSSHSSPKAFVRKCSSAWGMSSSRKFDSSNIKTLIFIGGIAIACCSPYFIVSYIYSLISVQCRYYYTYVTLKGITTWLIFMNSACNPFIYGFININYRKYFLRWLNLSSSSSIRPFLR